MARQESKRKETLVFRNADRPRSGGLSAMARRGLAADRALPSRHRRAAVDEMRKYIAHGRQL